VWGLALLLMLPAAARATQTDLDQSKANEPPAKAEEPRAGTDADLPNDGRPIVATVVEVDEDAGRVTLDTPHGRVDLSVTQDVAGRLSPGDVVVLRLTDEDSDSPSASPREEPAPSTPGTRI
jgi:hypothetical protein